MFIIKQRKFFMKRIIAGVFITLLATAVAAVGDEQEKDAVSGRLATGFMVIDSSDNLNPDGSEKKIDNLNSAAERQTSVVPVLLPTVTWDVGEPGQFKLFLNGEPPIDEVGSFALNVGGSQQVSGVGIVEAGMFFTPFARVWKNPYLTGVNREKTETSKYGAGIGFNRIMGTGLRLNAAFMVDEVDDDEIGRLIPDLARDGSIFAINANYSIYLSETLELRPRLGIRMGEYDGESNSFVKYKAEIEARYRVGRFMAIPRVFFSHSEYDKVNPLFGVTRENDSYGVRAMMNYLAPFGLMNWSLQLLAGYSRGDSNIDFYDTEGLSAGVFASYSF